MMKPWIVGESNPYGDDSRFALYPAPTNCAGWRLCYSILELKPDEYLARFERRNLLGRGKWSAKAAREAAARVLAESSPAPLILLGAKVATAFGFEWQPFRVYADAPTGRLFALLPHPSGRSRSWNEPDAASLARRTVTRLEALAAGKQTYGDQR